MFFQRLTLAFGLVIDWTWKLRRQTFSHERFNLNKSNISFKKIVDWKGKKRKKERKEKKRKTKISWRGQSSSPYTFRLGRGWYIYCTRYAERSGEVLHKNIFDARKKIVNFSVYNLPCTLDTHVSPLLMSRPVLCRSIDQCTNTVLTKSSFFHNFGIDKSCLFRPLCILNHIFFWLQCFTTL